MPADIIVYALVAAGLIFWLRSVLGTRHGDEKQRPNPYMASAEKPSDAPIEGLYTELELPETPEDKVRELVENPVRGMRVDNKTAENGLVDITKIDREFDVRVFLEAAQDAFAIIVESFAEGDRETLKDLLAPPVYAAFEGAINVREEKGESVETEIHAIKRAEIIEAWLDKKTAYITVRFTAEETSVTKDSESNIIAGDADRISEMRDIWVFSRVLKSRDPRWLLQETRGGFDDDNELLPNSDD
ncbi:MAG: Tim44 domain-containing protein [Alphaproteobacteria bacterium]|nr:Tim44 domain-containing protein [Alphaproteobacteria bacterium]